MVVDGGDELKRSLWDGKGVFMWCCGVRNKMRGIRLIGLVECFDVVVGDGGG